MKRLAVVAFASLALFLGACDDDDPKRPDAGRDGGAEVGAEAGSEGGTPGACIGTFAGVTRTQLGAAVAMKPGAKCSAPGDLDAICTSDIGGQIRSKYAPTCLPARSVGGNAAVASCIEEGVKRDFMGLSTGCISCYTASVVCTLEMCLIECASDPTAKVCSDCQMMKGCISAFFTCSGLPGGGAAPPADAGAETGRDGGGDTGGDTPVDSGGADAPADAGADTATDSGSDV